jgi:hypothetical protein
MATTLFNPSPFDNDLPPNFNISLCCVFVALENILKTSVIVCILSKKHRVREWKLLITDFFLFIFCSSQSGFVFTGRKNTNQIDGYDVISTVQQVVFSNEDPLRVISIVF